MLYLTINLLKGMKGLNPQELVIALSSIDAVSASISMAFSDKDVLAARTLVAFGFLTQIAAYGVQAAAFREYMQRDRLQCEPSTPPQLSSQHYSTAYWIYFSFRITASMLPVQVVHRLTSSLNKIENRNNATRSTRVKATALWGSLPATLATSYMVFWPFILLHGLSIFDILRGTNTIGQSWHSLTSEWGQSANAIIAVFAICHVAYAVHRLFVADNTIDGAQTSELSARSISRAYPQMGWMAWKHWPWTKPRWPFHLGLDYPDHLLVDESLLERVLNPPLIIDPVVRQKLWQELMDGFTYNDPDGIIDCLDQGAPLDEPNSDGDYPIHLAARHNNTDILMRTRFNYTKDSINHDSLLLKNSASETPLEVACNANTPEAVRWIMEHLPQTHTESVDAVLEAFKIAILGEKAGILRILQHLWPEWRALEIQSQFDKVSLLRFAIKEHKAKSAYRLTDPAVVSTRQSNARRIFELGWKSELDEYSVEIILSDRKDRPSRRISNRGLAYQIIAFSTLDNDEKLELLLALNIDISTILLQSVTFAADQNFDPDRTGNMWEHILQEGYEFESKDLDSIITYELTVRDDASDISPPPDPDETKSPWFIDPEYDADQAKVEKDRASLLRSRIRDALIHCGGRDWSEAKEAVTHTSTKDLERLISLEMDAAMLQRMLNVENRHHVSLLRHAMACEPGEQTIECIELLLKHGSRIKSSDLASARYGANITRYGEYITRYGEDITIFMLLATYAKHEVASEALRGACNPTSMESPVRTHMLFQILLRCGASPTLMDENGKTPRDIYRGVSDLITERWGDGPDNIYACTPLEELRKRRMGRGIKNDINEVMSLLQRWEDYHNNPKTGKPSDRPDPDWEALCDHIDESKWALLIEKNPEGFKIVEEH